jgi:hypothetical protein
VPPVPPGKPLAQLPATLSAAPQAAVPLGSTAPQAEAEVPSALQAEASQAHPQAETQGSLKMSSLLLSPLLVFPLPDRSGKWGGKHKFATSWKAMLKIKPAFRRRVTVLQNVMFLHSRGLLGGLLKKTVSCERHRFAKRFVEERPFLKNVMSIAHWKPSQNDRFI